MKTLKMLISILTSAQLMFLQLVVPITTTASLFPSTVYADTAEEAHQANSQESQAQADQDSQPQTAEEAHQENAEETIENGLTETTDSFGDRITSLFSGLDPGSAAAMMNFVMMLLIGILTASLFACQKYSYDIIAGAIGGVIYIGGEIMQLFKSEAKYEQEKIEYNVTSTGAPDLTDTQSEAFDKQKKGYQEAKSAALNKAKMQKAASVVWLVASGVALTLSLTEKMALAACLATTAGPQAVKCGPEAATAANLAAVKDLPKDSMTDFSTAFAAAPMMNLCCAGYAAAVVSSVGACSGALILGSNSGPQFGDPLLDSYFYAQNQQQESQKMMCERAEAQNIAESDVFMQVIEKAMNVVFPVAKAANPLVTLFGGLGTGIAIIILFKKSLGTMIDLMIGSPMKRSIVFGVLGGIGMMVAKQNEEVADKMQENINKIEAIQNRFNNLKVSKGIINSAFNRTGDLTSIPLRAGAQIGTADKPFPCLSQNKDKKCVSSKSMLDASYEQSNLDIPGGLTGLAGIAGSTADGISGQSNLTAGAVNGVNTLAANAKKANQLRRALQKKYNKQLKKTGKKPVNFAKSENDFLKKLQGSMLKTMKKNNLTPSDAFASAFPGTSPKLVAKDVKGELKKEVQMNKKVAVNKPTTPNNNGGFNFQLDADELETEEFPEEEIGLAGMEEGDLEVDDIVQDENVSIFKVISVRYLKSGYPRVLKQIGAKNK